MAGRKVFGAGPGRGPALRTAAALRVCWTRLGPWEDGGSDRRLQLGLPQGIRVLGQLLGIGEVLGRHLLMHRGRKPLEVEGQEELPCRLIRRQLRQHGVHHVCRPPITQLYGGQELREQNSVRRSIGL